MIIALPARAKLNLDLRVLRKLADGFHELDTMIQAIDLHDLVELEPASRTTLEISGMQIASEGENSILKAHRAIEEAAHRKLPTRFRLHKRIPAGSGLGGASSDAASALRALKELHRLEVDLSSIAAGVGADVPFFLHGGRMRATGRGERLAALPPAPMWFAIAWPQIELSTAAVYRAWDAVNGNDLARAAMHLDRRIGRFARELGGGWQMTGSGSAFFKRCDTERDARQAIRDLDCWTAIAHAVAAWG